MHQYLREPTLFVHGTRKATPCLERIGRVMGAKGPVENFAPVHGRSPSGRPNPLDSSRLGPPEDVLAFLQAGAEKTEACHEGLYRLHGYLLGARVSLPV